MRACSRAAVRSAVVSTSTKCMRTKGVARDGRDVEATKQRSHRDTAGLTKARESCANRVAAVRGSEWLQVILAVDRDHCIGVGCGT